MDNVGIITVPVEEYTPEIILWSQCVTPKIVPKSISEAPVIRDNVARLKSVKK